MDRVQRFVVVAAVACCVVLALAAVAPVDAAAVHSKATERGLSELPVFRGAHFENRRLKRTVANGNGTPTTDGPPKICHSSTPCGWAIYKRYTRRVEYFMKNTCDCPRGKICSRTDDDLSVSAFVYRCITPPFTTTTTTDADDSA